MKTVLGVAAAFAGVLAAQQQSRATSASAADQAVPSLAALGASVRKAHQTDGKAVAIETFEAKVDVLNLEKGQNLTLTIAALWKKGGLLRYEILGGETRKEQGIDEEGEWERVGMTVNDLRSARSDTGLLQVQQNLRVCDQLVRFFDPAQLLEDLQGKSAPRREVVKLSDAEKDVPCLVVQGYLPQFPLSRLRPDELTKRVRCELCFQEQTSRLRGVRAVALDDRDRPRGPGEWTVLHELTPGPGFLLPKRLVVYEVSAAGQVAVAKVEIGQTKWNVPLTTKNFRRP